MAIERCKIRGFEVCRGWEDKEVQLPTQATAGSAGYDFYIVEDVVIPSIYDPYVSTTKDIHYHKPVLVPTGIKAYMRHGEVLMVFIRSSLARKGLMLANNTAIIDKDFYSNSDNDGHINLMLVNYSNEPSTLRRGDRVGQGVFMPFLQADQPRATGTRTGGFGSSGT